MRYLSELKKKAVAAMKRLGWNKDKDNGDMITLSRMDSNQACHTEPYEYKVTWTQNMLVTSKMVRINIGGIAECGNAIQTYVDDCGNPVETYLFLSRKEIDKIAELMDGLKDEERKRKIDQKYGFHKYSHKG